LRSWRSCISSYNTKRDENGKLIRNDARRKKIIKLIAGLTYPNQIKTKVIKQLFLDNMDYIINTYARLEKLPQYFVDLAKQKNCLEIIIRGFLQNDAGYLLTSALVKQIAHFVQTIKNNENNEIVYDRVQTIQQYLHEKVDSKQGIGMHKALYPQTIKNILSASRLYLNIEDIKTRDSETLLYLITKSDEASQFEEAHPTELQSFTTGEKYTSSKKVRDMKSLIDFSYFNIEKAIYDISRLGSDCLLSYKTNIINLYAAALERCEYEDKCKWHSLKEQ